MDTPTITQYYRESDPARRLALLNMSIEAGEEPELNQICKMLQALHPGRRRDWSLKNHSQNM